MNEPMSLRAAVQAELLGEIDRVLQRVEALPQHVESSSTRIEQAATELLAATERHRVTVAAVNAQALKGIGEFAARRTKEATHASLAEHDSALRLMVRHAFQSELAQHTRTLNDTLARAVMAARRPAWPMWGLVAVGALAGALVSASCVFLLSFRAL
jgi:hypothetical protein